MTTHSLLPTYPNGWPNSGRSEDLFRFVVAHVSDALTTPLADEGAWFISTTAALHRAIVKRPILQSIELNGKVLYNDYDVATCFARELRLFRTVNPHPHLVEFYGHIDGVGLVIQAVEGVTISDKIEGRPFPSDTLKITWANQLIRTIIHIHSFGLSHGDISPGNVIIDPQGNVKLIDFGRSAQAGEELFPASHPFTAPDNMHSSHDPALSDAYAFGVLLLSLERNKILEDMVTRKELEEMALPLFGDLVLRYTIEDRHSRSKIQLSHVLPVPAGVNM